MRLRSLCLSLLALLFALVPVQAQTPAPEPGQWVPGPAGSAKDIGQDAVSSGQFAVGNNVLTNSARLLLGCKREAGPRPTLELRALVLRTPGLTPGSVANTATLSVGDDSARLAMGVYPVGAMTIFVVSPSPAQLKRMASLTLDQRANLTLRFSMGSREAALHSVVVAPNEATTPVLTACGIAIPKAAAVASRATAGTRRFTFMGLYLGMTAQEAAGAEKAIATTPIKPGVGGGMDFSTAEFDFISVTPDESGVINFYKVCGKPSRSVKSGSNSGPLYDAAVKAFGPPLPKAPNQFATQWDKSGGVDARYEYDKEDDPGGCIYVAKAG